MNPNLLMLRGASMLSRVSNNGIRIDVDYFKHHDHAFGQRADELLNFIVKDYGSLWRKRFGEKTKFSSRDQLAIILQRDFKTKRNEVLLTPTGKPSASLEALMHHMDIPLVQWFVEYQKIIKTRNTYIRAFLREQVDGFLHPFFNLHLARSQRSSSDRPNFQNVPIRDDVIGPLLRRGIIARDGNNLAELDYAGAEVRIGACYHRDPMMIAYINDTNMDMHRDMAAQIFGVPTEQVSSVMRHIGKNSFVFPQFYGSGYVGCAKNIWETLQREKINTKNGRSALAALRDLGITKLGTLDYDAPLRKGTFTWHMSKIQEDFWRHRFVVYESWKQRWYESYLDKGYFEMLTGFRVSGPLIRRQITNYPIQGTAFHCLLWSMIRLQEQLDKRKMQALLIGQIHDSILADVPESELDEFIFIARDIMVNQIATAYDWLIVPMEIEANVSAINGNWAEKVEYKL